MVTVENLAFGYVPGVSIMRDVSFSVGTGEFIAVGGRNGCGKTTVTRLLMGLEKPDAGKVLREGTVSAVFQEDRLLDSLSAQGNLRFVVGRDREADIKGVLDELGLGDALDKQVRAFSGGMKRRVAIARALVMAHDILLLDEPFKGLDEEMKARAAQAILRHEAGKTVILVTHEPQEAVLLNAEVFRLP